VGCCQWFTGVVCDCKLDNGWRVHEVLYEADGMRLWHRLYGELCVKWKAASDGGGGKRRGSEGSTGGKAASAAHQAKRRATSKGTNSCHSSSADGHEQPSGGAPPDWDDLDRDLDGLDPAAFDDVFREEEALAEGVGSHGAGLERLGSHGAALEQVGSHGAALEQRHVAAPLATSSSAPGHTKAWADLTAAEREAARVLGFGEAEWEAGETPAVCRQWWDTLCTQPHLHHAALVLGYLEEIWDAELEEADEDA
jgi:hypothetical protein